MLTTHSWAADQDSSPTRPAQSIARAAKMRLPDLPERIVQTLKDGDPEVMPAAAAKDLGLEGEQKLVTFNLTESSGTKQFSRSFSIAYVDDTSGRRPLYLLWSLTTTTEYEGKTAYDVWSFKTDLAGRLEAASHGTSDERHVEDSPSPLNDISRNVFTNLRGYLVRPASKTSMKK